MIYRTRRLRAVAAAVYSLVLCSVRDQQPALAEVRRVLKTAARLRFYEHVLADTAGFARVQRIVVYPHVSGGCHVTRDTEVGDPRRRL